MPPETVYVTTHIHIDGPIPGPHSLLTLASAAYPGTSDGTVGEGPTSTFTVNVGELPGATLHPTSLWRGRAEDWLTTRRHSRPPAVAMNAYARWVSQIRAQPVFVADPIEPDYPFLYWYLQRFTGQWPFARTSTDVDLHARLTRTTMCPLTGCRRTSLVRTS